MNVVWLSYINIFKWPFLYPLRRSHYKTKINESDDFIGKFRRLQQAGKEANLVLNTHAGNAWTTLSVRIGHGGPGQNTHQQKAWGAQNGPAQQRCLEKRATARNTQVGAQNDTAEADAVTEDATEIDGPTNELKK